MGHKRDVKVGKDLLEEPRGSAGVGAGEVKEESGGDQKSECYVQTYMKKELWSEAGLGKGAASKRIPCMRHKELSLLPGTRVKICLRWACL